MGKAIGKNNGIIGNLSIKIGVSKIFLSKIDRVFINNKVQFVGKIIDKIQLF